MDFCTFRFLKWSHKDQQSWLTSEIPVDWKIANVTPIYKKGWKEDPGYLQACQSDPSAKEGYGADRLQCHHAAHTGQQVVRPIQHGFMKGRSCLTNLISFCDKVTRLVDDGKAVVIFYLSKAFDTIYYSILLEKLAAHGLGVPTLR
ncbi:rna-directed dna polymerase from mobile element jockey-like [Limosa lapponica baueri]|uniref:Rna-directed dna polymerase from mobile element jockey-like n=1 Tax=Limosa lapponica baueri TaxID=1758121 RepID=A0A2I0UBS0_LIMLA|nr:rna-directed dna polymerase from mobile element jockey-like [Limosa lapponica baueri]